MSYLNENFSIERVVNSDVDFSQYAPTMDFTHLVDADLRPNRWQVVTAIFLTCYATWIFRDPMRC